MKFSKPREFKAGSQVKVTDLVAFLGGLNVFFKELFEGLTKLRFEDNFRGCWIEENLIIPASSELEIRNQVRGTIPTKWILVKRTGNTIVDGDTEWTQDFVYLKNSGVADVTVSVLFLQ